MSNLRAIRRRQEKQINKVMQDKTDIGVMKRAWLAGKQEGMELATSIILVGLHDHWGFGERRMRKLFEYILSNSNKYETGDLPTRLNVDYYRQSLRESCKIFLESEIKKTKFMNGKCNNCGQKLTGLYTKYQFCPYCGAPAEDFNIYENSKAYK